MPSSVNDQSRATAAEALEEALNQVSVRIMVEGIGATVLADLRSLGEQARQGDCDKLADRTAALVDSLTNGTGKDIEGILRTGIDELRLMISNEKAGLPANAPPPYASLGDDAELIADFLVEAREHLSLIEGQLLTLERDPGAMEIIHAVFRAFHTIKGLAGFLGFSVMQGVAHEVETLLDLARNEKIRIDTPIVDVVLASADFLLVEMASIDRVLGGAESADPADSGDLIARIRLVAVTSQGGQPEVAPAKAVSVVEPPAQPVAAPAKAEVKETKKAASKGKATKKKASVSTPAQVEPAVVAASEPPTPQAEEPEDDFFPAVPSAFIAAPEPVKPEPIVVTPPPQAIVPTAAPAESRAAVPAKPTEVARTSEPAKTPDSGSVRVETAKLDYLMDMVGEMVIAQSLIRHSHVLLSSTDSRLIGDLSHLARVTAEVQRATMSMRMVPVANLFQKIERVIRDLSRKAGKQVVLQTSGTDTEVDKTVAEELSDPLLHMVRNSVDHGIETPEERIAAGKPPVAIIKLAAYHQGGQIVIEISDDGRGLNAEKIRRKAEEKEIITPNVQLTELEVYQLIFAPGFSTAEKITDVSGRGVGMDVVRRNVEKLRGRIETQSELGKGTTFLLKLPLTLAIIDGLVVEVGNNHYIVPLSVVREIFQPLASTLFSVEGKEEMVLVREQLLPIVRLNQRLGVKSRIETPSQGLLVVVESENKLYCMLVDDLLGKQEVVIKSLGETFQDASGFSGCAVLGDGRVGLILDTDGIYRGRRR
ncbi:two-component system chemotaxis sensor kinase CheA [Granulicella aggregans]|uniref:Chemotaxis protein CheA n=1 Tax=Granulicella aggregans TaxID=474949 RepID=A0A7W7ZH35_9BACT|nr:chemotaxis protein CheA [Granulicella aggregans]MBB5059141.1 two-component system chemotaxis sensor kinase CheA [Granulicella aggregans]